MLKGSKGLLGFGWVKNFIPMEDGFERSPSQLGNACGMHESDFVDSEPVESNARGPWFA
jgi:hypothetical protein